MLSMTSSPSEVVCFNSSSSPAYNPLINCGISFCHWVTVRSNAFGIRSIASSLPIKPV